MTTPLRAALRLVALAVVCLGVCLPARAFAAVGMCGEDAQSVVAPLIEWSPPGSEARAACPGEAFGAARGALPSDPGAVYAPPSVAERCLPSSARWPVAGRAAHQGVVRPAASRALRAVDRGVYRPPR
ncbi:MAG: hypothetical protein IT376_13270 [Polyangiaceae bacterium]|nr:hypothetical protein [Polyangiaceae bacterium]